MVVGDPDWAQNSRIILVEDRQVQTRAECLIERGLQPTLNQLGSCSVSVFSLHLKNGEINTEVIHYKVHLESHGQTLYYNYTYNLAILRPISQTIFMEPRSSEIKEIKTFEKLLHISRLNSH